MSDTWPKFEWKPCARCSVSQPAKHQRDAEVVVAAFPLPQLVKVPVCIDEKRCTKWMNDLGLAPAAA